MCFIEIGENKNSQNGIPTILILTL